MSDNKARRVIVWEDHHGLKYEHVADHPSGTHMLVPVEVWEGVSGLIGAVVAAGLCPECGDGRGFTVHPSMPDGEPEQVQCMWCDHARHALAEIGDENG